MSIRDTEKELLKATGNTWEVGLYSDGNRRRRIATKWVRASTREKAEAVALNLVTQATVASAYAWDPDREHNSGQIRRIVSERVHGDSMHTKEQEMKRTLITIPEAWLEAFKTRAAKQGQSLSEFMREAAAQQLTQRERNKLPPIKETRGRPSKD